MTQQKDEIAAQHLMILWQGSRLLLARLMYDLMFAKYSRLWLFHCCMFRSHLPMKWKKKIEQKVRTISGYFKISDKSFFFFTQAFTCPCEYPQFWDPQLSISRTKIIIHRTSLNWKIAVATFVNEIYISTYHIICEIVAHCVVAS